MRWSRCRSSRTRSSCLRSVPAPNVPNSHSRTPIVPRWWKWFACSTACRWRSSSPLRARELSLAQLVERLRDRFSLLGGRRGVGARQATLRGAIDWSWDLLAPWEQAAFAQCSAFDGGFTLEAAEAVVELEAWPQAPPAMDVILALADKSLLRTWTPAQRTHDDLEGPFFGMYLSIHEYAQDKLASSGDGAQRDAEVRHGRCFAGLGSDEALEALSRHGGVRRRRTLALEFDNVVTACRRAMLRGDGSTALATYRAAWEVIALQGPFVVGAALGVSVLAVPGLDECDRLAALATLAQALRRAGRAQEAQARLEDALRMARRIGDVRHEGCLLLAFGGLHREQGRPAQARECHEAALAIARRVGDHAAESNAQSGLGILHREHGQIEQARECFATALAIARAEGDRREEGIVLGSLGLLASEAGQAEAAQSHLAAALDIARDVGDRTFAGAVHANLGQLCNEQGLQDAASEHFNTALAIQREVGNRRLEAIVLGNLGAVCTQQGRAPEAHGYLQAALTIAREIGNRRHEGFLLLGLGILLHEQGCLPQAREHYDAALAVAREVEDRRSEAITLSRLGLLLVDLGQREEARAHYDFALVQARQGRYRRLEGVILGGIGDLLARDGKVQEGLVSLRSGEEILREVRDREELGKLLCIRGKWQATAHDREAARAAMTEAEAIAAALQATPTSEVSRGIAHLRDALCLSMS